MKIIVDSQETANIIKQLCDIALKSVGIQNLQGVVAVLNSLKIDSSSKKPIEESNKETAEEKS